MAVPKWIADIAAWFAKAFGPDLVVLAMAKLQHHWRRLFASKNILILGARQTGKTSLLLYMQEGQPFEVVDGTIRTPNPTAMAAVVDQRFAIDQGNWVRLQTDVPGDLDLRAAWAQAIADLQPQGIIYMVDGRLDEPALNAAIDELFRDVVDRYVDGAGALAALHVFLNYADGWARSRLEESSRARMVAGLIEARLQDYPLLHELRIDIAATQLSASKRSWPEAERALKRFGADLSAS